MRRRTMYREGYSFTCDGPGASEDAAELFGYLAYPNESDKREYFAECALELLDRDRISRGRQKDALKAVRDGLYRVNHHRYPASEIGRDLLARDAIEKIALPVAGNDNQIVGKLTFDYKLPDGSNASLNKASRYISASMNDRPDKYRERKNSNRWTQKSVIQRIWSPSKPVLHLAIAFFNTEGVIRCRCLEYCLRDTSWMKPILKWAHHMAQEIHSSPSINITREDLILFVPQDWADEFEATGQVSLR